VQVGLPGKGTGERERSQHSRPKLGAMPRTKKYRTAGGSSAFAPGDQSRIADEQRLADDAPVAQPLSTVVCLPAGTL
jgi:hypothetical protein